MCSLKGILEHSEGLKGKSDKLLYVFGLKKNKQTKETLNLLLHMLHIHTVCMCVCMRACARILFNIWYSCIAV